MADFNNQSRELLASVLTNVKIFNFINIIVIIIKKKKLRLSNVNFCLINELIVKMAFGPVDIKIY